MPKIPKLYCVSSFDVMDRPSGCTFYNVCPCYMSLLSTDSLVLSRMQIENYNQPYLSCLHEYDDGKDLTKYDFEADCFSSPFDDVNKRKLAYRHRAIGDKYAKVSQ